MLIFPFVPPYSSFYQMNQLHFTDYPLEVTKIKNGKVTENETYFYKLLTADSKSLVKDKVSYWENMLMLQHTKDSIMWATS